MSRVTGVLNDVLGFPLQHGYRCYEVVVVLSLQSFVTVCSPEQSRGVKTVVRPLWYNDKSSQELLWFSCQHS